MPAWNRNESRPERRRVPIYIYATDGSPAPATLIIEDEDALVDKGDGHYVPREGTFTNTDVPLVVADVVVDDVDDTTDRIEIGDHGLVTGDGPFQFTTSGTLPDGLDLATDYWIIYVDADRFQVADSLSDAINGNEIDLLDAGTGTHTLVDTGDTRRLNDGLWMYEASQSEIDYLGSYFAIRFSKLNYDDVVTTVDILEERSMHAGSAAGGGASTITLDATASSTNSIYNDAIVILTGGTGRGQVNSIASYVGGTKVATMARAWAVQPIAGTEYVIVPGPSGSSSSGIATAVWAAIGEGAHTYGDLVRGLVGAEVGPTTGYNAGSIVAKSLNGAKTRWTWTVDETGRLTVTPGDLT